jgi:hypothetical protein
VTATSSLDAQGWPSSKLFSIAALTPVKACGEMSVIIDLPNSKSSRWGGGVTADEM